MIKRFAFGFLYISAAAIAPGVQAQTSDTIALFNDFHPTPYLQGSLGVGHISSPSSTGTAMNLDGNTTTASARVSAGLQLNPHFGLEGTWFQLSDTKVQTSVGEANHKGAAYVASITASVPLKTGVDVVGRLGAGRSDVKVTVPTTTYQSNSRQNLTVWGLGARFSINKSMDLALDYDNLGAVGKYALGDRVKVEMFSLGLRFKF
jgi:hypothetical protein